MIETLRDFAVDGIDGRIASNPAPDILVGIEAGSVLDGYSSLIKLLPKNNTVLVPLAIGGDMDWFAAFAGDGPVFLRVTKRGFDTVVEVVDEPSATAMDNLVWMMNQLPKEIEPKYDFDIEVTFDPSG